MPDMIKADNDNIHEIVGSAINELGVGADLNHIDVSKVTNMNGLFRSSRFVGDISKWDTSKVKNISFMFYSSVFNGDISEWNLNKVDVTTKAFMHSRIRTNLSKLEFSIKDNDSKMFKGSRYLGSCNGKWYKNGSEMNEAEFLEHQLEALGL
jgi:hypothetical protein